MNNENETIFDAIEFAAKAHRGQFRKGTKLPYIIHPIAVGMTLINYDCPVEVIAAGILHDTVEDTAVTIEEIEKNFGTRIADLVKAVSEPDKSDTWENRKKHTLEMLKTASMDVLYVECADKLDNITQIREDYLKSGGEVWSRFKRPEEYQKWYYKNLAEIFSSRALEEPFSGLAKKFSSTVNEVFGEEDAV